MIAIIDYGMGNIASIRNMLSVVGSEATVTADPRVVSGADKLILPGVGAFDAGMRNLASSGLIAAIEHAVAARRVPILGICLGMQLMCKSSTEGGLPGLGWIEASIIRFRHSADSGYKVPHMGWNAVSVAKQNPLLPATQNEHRFYFVHSYHAVCDRPADVLATAHHGYEFHAAFSRDNILGVQFHPEKSHRFGRELIKNFVEL